MSFLHRTSNLTVLDQSKIRLVLMLVFTVTLALGVNNAIEINRVFRLEP